MFSSYPDRVGQIANERYAHMLAEAGRRQRRHEAGRPARRISAGAITRRLATAFARPGAVTTGAPRTA
jgi:hypothetical protein